MKRGGKFQRSGENILGNFGIGGVYQCFISFYISSLNYNNIQIYWTLLNGSKIMQSFNSYNNQSPAGIRFPKIQTKARSLPGQRRAASILDDITAKAWIYSSNNTQYGYKTNLKREIASLTKIMTCLCTLELCEKYNINKNTTYFKVTQWASCMIGTSANLIQNAWVSVQDLLYGMMLPSGNDAATVLAQNLGAVIYFDKSGNKTLTQQIRSIDLTQDKESVKFYMYEFVAHMNEKCLQLKLSKTRFANAHGMDMLNNYSCCEDILKLTKQAMKSEEFKKIVKTQNHKGALKFFKEGKVICRPIYWNNTNKLLQKTNVIGVKTGITAKAGGCLSTFFMNSNGEEGIIVMLGSLSAEDRFRDTLKIMRWLEEECV